MIDPTSNEKLIADLKEVVRTLWREVDTHRHYDDHIRQLLNTPYVQHVETSSDVAALLTVQQENKRLRGALARISVGTPDLLPPYRFDEASQLRDIAIKALQKSSPKEPMVDVIKIK